MMSFWSFELMRPIIESLITHSVPCHCVHKTLSYRARKSCKQIPSNFLAMQCKRLSTIMDKSPWDSQSVTSIPCVSQEMSQKATLSFYKSMFPPPSPPNTLLKDQMNCALTVSTLSVGWGKGVGTYSVSSTRIQFRVC